MASDYLLKRCETRLQNLFLEKFETDGLPPLNLNQRIFIIAEEIPDRIANVCRFLRTFHGMDISCIEFCISNGSWRNSGKLRTNRWTRRSGRTKKEDWK
jgi:hypothetical protein